MDEKKLKEKLDQILFEIRWIQQNMNPPVNYCFVIIISVIASAITTLIVRLL